MRKKYHKLQNNSGSTLIVVLVAVSFLAVIAAIIMSVSSANLRMKQLEYASKQNFYVDEIGLDDVYNGIGKDVSKALTKAYTKTLMEASATGKYPTQKAAYIAFAGSLFSELKTLYGDETEGAKPETLAKLNSYISRKETGEALEVIGYKGAHIVPDTETGAELFQYILQGVTVKYLENNLYESVITTDIVIEVPYIDFFQNFDQILDYSLIGNKGITFKGTAGADAGVNVEGNVYAGVASTTDGNENASYGGYMYDTNTYDGMNFYKAIVRFKDSSYIISKGDFNICESGVTIESKTSTATGEAQSNLWAENIRTVENGRNDASFSRETLKPSTLNAVANIYAADDLELNARNSNVTLNGSYYGYNYNNSGSGSAAVYDTWEKGYLQDKYQAQTGKTAAAHTTSSSIVVNANNSVLDLSGLNTLMVAGVAYVDIKTPNKAYGSLNAGEALEYRTGESVAMRYNQFLYLAPSEILNGVSNPQKNGTTDVKTVCPSENNLKLQNWFGNQYLNSDNPVTAAVYSDNGVSYTYYFLNVEGKEKEYIQSFMSLTADPGEEASELEKQKWEMKQMVEKKASASNIASHITLRADGSEGSAKIYTTGLLTDSGEAESVLQKNSISLDDMAGRSNNMQKRYAQLYVNLEPNQTGDVEDSKKPGTEYPLKNFLDVSKFPGSLHIESKTVKGVNGANVWILEEVGGVKPALDVGTETKKGIVLCNGNLSITGNGGTFEGLVIATGKITIGGNVTIRANRGVVQSVLESEQRSVIELSKEDAESVKLTEYASYYFLHTVLSGLTNSDLENKLIDTEKRVTSTEYTDYIYYKNWQKGEVETAS